MGHNLNIKANGMAAMMYVGEKPWHSLGTKLDNPATAAEAIAAAGLDFVVEKRELFINVPDTNDFTVVENNFATVRMDTNKVLGVVGDRYTPLQNKDAFSFFDAIVGEKAAIYHTAGALGNGERVWILAKIPGDMHITKDDVVEKYLLLSNSHDGTSTVNIMWTPIRVVCQNTLNAAIDEADNIGRLRHTASIGTRIDAVRETLGIISGYYATFETLSKKMTKIQINKKEFNQFLQKIKIVTPDEDNKLSTRAENILNEVTHLFEHGKGNDTKEVKGTVWAAYNAVTEYADYVRVSRSQENRSKSILYGSGAALKQRAWDGAMRLIK